MIFHSMSHINLSLNPRKDSPVMPCRSPPASRDCLALTNIRLRHDLKGCHDGANKFVEVYCIYIVMEPARKKQQNQSSKSI